MKFYLIGFSFLLLLGCSSMPSERETDELRNFFCKGSKVKRNPSISFEVDYPKPRKGTSLEDATRERKNIEANIEKYLRTWFIFDVFSNYKFKPDQPPFLRREGWDEFDRIVGEHSSITGSSSYPSDKRLNQIYMTYGFPMPTLIQCQTLMGKVQGSALINDDCWQYISLKDTSFQKANLDDGNTRYTATVAMDNFCQYAVKKSDLVVQ